MKLTLTRSLSFSVLTAVAAAQGSDYQRVLNPWPASLSGSDTAIACGDFLPNSFSRSAVIVRSGTLYQSFQPAVFEHFHAEGITGVTAIATVVRTQPDPDLLVTITANGLQVLRVTGGVFVPAGTIGVPVATWIGANAVKTFVLTAPGLPSDYVLGIAGGWVRVAALDAGNDILPLSAWSPPQSATVLDAALVDWVAGGAPEIAVLTTTGGYVLDLAGNVLATLPSSDTAGKLVHYRMGAVPAVTVVRGSVGSTSWTVETWRPTGPGGSAQVFAGGTATFPGGPLGLGVMQADPDTDADLVVSTIEPWKRILRGSSNGPQAGNAFIVPDVAAAPVPASPNTAPCAIDDIDHDGAPDLVIPQAATNQLVVIPRLRAQASLIEFNQSFATQDQPAFFRSLGFDPVPDLSDPAYTPPNDLGAIAALRLEVPTGWTSSNWWVFVNVYGIATTGNGEVFDPTAQFQFSYTPSIVGPLVEGTACYADIPIPVSGELGNSSATDRRRLFEVTTVSTNSGVPVVSASVYVQLQMRDGSQGWSAFAAGIPSTATIVTPIEFATDLNESTWTSGQAAAISPLGEAPKRFIGAKFRVAKAKSSGSADAPSPHAAGQAIMHQ